MWTWTWLDRMNWCRWLKYVVNMAGFSNFPTVIAPPITIMATSAEGKDLLHPSSRRWSSTQTFTSTVWSRGAAGSAHTFQQCQYLHSPGTKIDHAVWCQEPRGVILLLQTHLQHSMLQEGAESRTRHTAGAYFCRTGARGYEGDQHTVWKQSPE